MSQEQNPSIGGLYATAREIANLAEQFSESIRPSETRQIMPLANGWPFWGCITWPSRPIVTLSNMAAQTCHLLRTLGGESDVTTLMFAHDAGNTHIERQITRSRQHRPAILFDGEYPNALRAVAGLGIRVIRAVEIACLVSPGEDFPEDWDTRGGRPESNSVTDSSAWQKSFQIIFSAAGILDKGKWKVTEWLEFCERFAQEVPRIDLLKIKTLLSLEETGIQERERDIPAQLADPAKPREQSVIDEVGETPLQISPTMKKILTTCRRKHFKGETLANKVGLSYDYARKVFAKLVKAGKLRNDPDKGYRTVL